MVGLAVFPHCNTCQFQVSLEILEIHGQLQCRINARLEPDLFRSLTCPGQALHIRARRLPSRQLRCLPGSHGAGPQLQFLLNLLDDPRGTGKILAVGHPGRAAMAVLARGINGKGADMKMLAVRIFMNRREPGDRAIPQSFHVMDRNPRPLLRRQTLSGRQAQRPVQHGLRQIAARCPQPSHLPGQGRRSFSGQGAHRQPLDTWLAQNILGQASEPLAHDFVSNHSESFSRILPTKSIIMPKCSGFNCWQLSLSRLSVDNSRPSIPQTSWATAGRARARRRPRAASRSHTESGRPQA